MSFGKFRHLTPLIGIVLFLYILTQIDLNKTYQILKNADGGSLVIALLLSLINVFPKAHKWRRLLKKEVSILNAYKAWMIGFSLSLVTPGKFGDVIRARFVGIKFSKALPTVIIDRLFDLIVLIILAFLGSFVLFPKYTLSLLALLLLFLICTIIFLHPAVYDFLFKMAKNIDFLKKEIVLFKSGVQEVNNLRILGLLFLWTLLSKIINIVAFYCLLLSVRIDLSIFVALVIMPLILVLEALPISIGSLGVREAGSIAMLGLFGVDAESAVAFSLLTFFINVLVALLGLIFWLKK